MRLTLVSLIAMGVPCDLYRDHEARPYGTLGRRT